jgi:hypothetical protein
MKTHLPALPASLRLLPLGLSLVLSLAAFSASSSRSAARSEQEHRRIGFAGLQVLPP